MPWKWTVIESEVVALHTGQKEGRRVQHKATEMGFRTENKVKVKVDSSAAKFFANSAEVPAKSKHIDTKYHKSRDQRAKS